MRNTSANEPARPAAALLVVGGIVLVLLGGFLFIAGGVSCLSYGQCLSGHPGGVPLLVIGGAFLYGGVKMVRVGGKRAGADQ